MLNKRPKSADLIVKVLKSSHLDEDFFYKTLTFTCCFFLTPFSFFWLLKGKFMLAFIQGLALIFFCCNFRQIINNQPELLPRSIVLAFIGSQLIALTFYEGSSATLWTYPLLSIYFFILPIKQANFAAISIAIPISYLLSLSGDVIFTIRYMSSITAILLTTNLIVIINSNLQQELVNQSIRDPLTHFYNRRHMDAIFEHSIRLFKRTAAPLSLLLIDIDHFKKVNDQFGHIVGDDILRQLVATILGHKRASDMLFRYGGEEFILLLPEVNSADALLIADKHRLLLSKILLPDTNKAFTVSIGVCEFKPAMSVDDWIKGADDGLYRAKRGGRNKVCA